MEEKQLPYIGKNQYQSSQDGLTLIDRFVLGEFSLPELKRAEIKTISLAEFLALCFDYKPPYFLKPLLEFVDEGRH